MLITIATSRCCITALAFCEGRFKKEAVMEDILVYSPIIMLLVYVLVLAELAHIAGNTKKTNKKLDELIEHLKK